MFLTGIIPKKESTVRLRVRRFAVSLPFRFEPLVCPSRCCKKARQSKDRSKAVQLIHTGHVHDQYLRQRCRK